MNPVYKNGIPFFKAACLDSMVGLSHGFFTRCGGVSPPPYATLNVGPLSDDAATNRAENLRRIAAVLGAPAQAVVAARQVHGTEVIRVTESNVYRSIFSGAPSVEGDALVTNRRGVWLGILTADCVPVLIVDPVNRVVAAIHAGWRGTYGRVVSHTILAMTRNFGSMPADLLAALGPAIGPCCYEVGEEVARLFVRTPGSGHPPVCRRARGAWSLDLARSNGYELEEAGIPEARIMKIPVCTRCQSDLFFSVRAQGDPTGRQIALIGLTGDDHEWAAPVHSRETAEDPSRGGSTDTTSHRVAQIA